MTQRKDTNEAFMRVNTSYGIFEMPDNDWIGRSIVLHGDYERLMLQKWTSILKQGDIAIDVGACFGTHAIFLAMRGIRVYAVEPVNHSWLIRNIRLNGMEKLIKVLPIAACESSMKFSYKADNGNAATATLIPGTEIEGERLDKLIQEKITLVKIDVEGMELQVLRGMTRIMEKHPHLFVECVDRDRLRQLDQILECNGYMRGEKFNATPTFHYIPVNSNNMRKSK